MSMVDLDDPVIMALTHARVKLLFAKPWFGQLATRLKLVDASKWCNTAATDGRHFFYNRQFILNLSPKELLFLFGHEVLHCVLDHLGRRGSRDPKIWNMANDYLVNYILKNEGVGEMPEGGLYDAKYTDGWTSEEIFDDLVKNCTTVVMTLDEHLELGDGRGEEDGDGDDGDGEGKSKGSGGGSVEVTVIGRDGPPTLTDKDLRAIRNELRAAAIQAAQGHGSDSVPAGIRRLIDELIEPKMDWRALLDAHIRSSLKDDYTFQRISRRSWGSGFVLPGQNFMDTIDIAISIDSSGSLSDEMLRDFLSEVRGIMETFRDFKIRMWTFDTAIHAYKEFSLENVDEINSYEPGGGGGTLFEANWTFMKDEGIEPQRLIMFTDGLPNVGWGEPDYCDTLFVIYGNPHITAPFGITAHYEPKSN